MRHLALSLMLLTAPVWGSPWTAALLAARGGGTAAEFERAWPKQSDWLRQDAGERWTACLDRDQGPALTNALLAKHGLSAEGLDEAAQLARYEAACEQRRERFLAPLRARCQRIVFIKHGPLGGSHYAYTEAQSDAQAERNFQPGAAVCLLDLASGEVRTLLATQTGMMRDPDVSYDGQRILFAWKKSDREDDFHLYELEAATGRLRQLTFGLGVADYEGAYLPGGDIVFNSTRCGQIVDCWWTEVSNLYRCGPDGDRLRRVSFDQVHTNYPTVLPDGRVVYTRWDYNDRGQIFPQGLFQMAADGTNQTAFYGNNSWFPTTVIHARGIPGSTRVMGIATGHHSFQPGKLIRIDPALGREEASGVTLLAPERPTPAERIDSYGQQGELFAYPYPLSETELLVTYNPRGWDPKVGRGRDSGFGIYFMNVDGRRELLAADPSISCNQSVPLAPRPEPRAAAARPEPTTADGTYYVQDVYRGPGLAGIARGAVKKLRVVAIEFRPAGIGSNSNGGPAGGALSSTPISLSNGAWDVKRILGDATVYPDGSAFFRLPARTPVYFQALDERNQSLQSMRTWSTLQPGENASCTGCHESKNAAPPNTGRTQALQAGAQDLAPFWGAPRGFSFAAEVQPLLDAKCVRCHDDPKQAPPRGARPVAAAALLDIVAPEGEWRYATTEPPAGWQQPGFDDSAWPTGRAGFGLRGTPGGRIGTIWDTPTIWLRRTVRLPAPLALRRPAWRVWHDEDAKVFVNGALTLSVQGFNQAFDTLPLTPTAAAALRPGDNLLAVTCTNTAGGASIDLALADEPPSATPAAQPVANHAFSLLNTPVADPRALRRWSAAYLALTQAAPDPNTGEWRGFTGDPVNWISVQSAPPMLPPGSGGALRSRLLPLLDSGHGGVQLTAAERDKLAAWIDLLVPFCGDYDEAANWSPSEQAKYRYYLAKRRRYAAIDGQAAPVEAPVTLSLVDAAGRVVATQTGAARRDQGVELTVNRAYAAGDTLRISGSADLVVRVDALWPEALVHLPGGTFDYKLPIGPEARAYPPQAFAGTQHVITARLAAAEERITYRNMARNPLDQRGEATTVYPHATTNSECRGESVFAARCAVDGYADNRGHGPWPVQSWGPDQRRDLWLKVDFGRPVEVDKLVLSIRADFPHDAWWRTATLEFSDGTRQPVTLTQDAGRQTFEFAPRRVTWVRLCDLVQPEPLGWAAISEMEVWGADVVGP
ncbi:MAG: hypothetical protein HZB16_16195 [Armatimonadetes bacterium]|nr:hypothetical protein [Armatimonadota bacterium]